MHDIDARRPAAACRCYGFASFSFSAAEEDRLRVKTQFLHLQQMRDVSSGGEIFMLYFCTMAQFSPIPIRVEYVFRGWSTGELTAVCSCYQPVIRVDVILIYIR